ncbi:glycoside hydrolase family 15 [Candidatus Woesearchaeota archaeon]|nr:glycoside hydrolase family 15 [Candidatus Woesearchaeota archaeon]
MITNSIRILRGLQHPSGLFSASALDVNTGYNKAWIRDCIYEALGLEAVKSWNEVRKAFHALLDVLKKHEYKIDYAIKEKPQHAYQYIHARYHPKTYNEFFEEWGNKQNDAIGALLFKISDLELKGAKILRDESDRRILQKLVKYLESIEYWHDKDNGMWEENEEIHASSVGACVAGLKKAAKLVEVNPEIVKKGEETLKKLLPRESETKEADLALLSLIYPYNIVDEKTKMQILKNVEGQLVRERGVIRYLGDQYYNKGFGEAEWTMGLAWLAIIYKQLNIPHKHAFYMRKCVKAANEKGELPELYYAGTDIHNENSPLGWAQSLFLVMMED